MKYIDTIYEIHSEIYIFGTGMVAQLLHKCLKNFDVRINAFVVSECCEMRSIDEIPVISVEEINNNLPVIIATLMNRHDEIENILIMNGISEYYAISESCFDAMRQSVVPPMSENASIKLRINEMKKLMPFDSLDSLMVCDNKFLNLVKEKNISSCKYLKTVGNYETIFVLSVKWQNNWKQIVEKAFSEAKNVCLSFRYGFLNSNNYSLIEIAKEKGFQLSATNRFYRDQIEYFTEDVLLWF